MSFEPSKVAPRILLFIRDNPTFTLAELDQFVRRRVGIVPGGSYTMLRTMKQRGQIRYSCYGRTYRAEIVEASK